MSVISVKEEWSGRLASGDGVCRSGTRTFTVVVSDPVDTPVMVQKAYAVGDGIPRKGDFYPGDGDLRCEAAVGVKALAPTVYRVTASYRTPTNSADEAAANTGSPISRAAVASWSFIGQDVEIDEDVNGKPLVNPNGEPYDPPITRPQNDPVLTIQRNEGVFDYRQAIRYMAKGGAVSEGSFLGAKAGQPKIASITSSGRRLENGVRFDPVTYEIHFREDGWKRRVLIQGFTIRQNKIIIPAGVPIVGRTADPEVFIIQARDAKGNPVTEPRLLTKEGFPLAPEAPAQWQELEIFPSLDFGPLGLQ